MKVKSAKSFRSFYKTEIKGIKENDENYNENFVGTYCTENNEKIKGFFEMYHGHKPDIANYLPSILKIAEDGQAIYEFLQNAVDCESTHFFVFYNEKYFLAINNGEPFDTDGLQSVLNIAQTTKKSCDKIGRFGIGFKLVHRLVGKNEGVNELVKEYKGPILFSWSKHEDLDRLLRRQIIEQIKPEKGLLKELVNAPFLLKLILTNFPADYNEVVKDLFYRDRIVFTKEELDELINFTNISLHKYSKSNDSDILKKGSLFFLRLGEGKKEMLDRDYEDLKKGVQFSMNTLNHLGEVHINNENIKKQHLELEKFEISNESDVFSNINPEYQDCNIKIIFGYHMNYKLSERIKESPNFYKYFPMGDETNGFSFIIHCDSFSNEANRRKLQKDQINKQLLPEIANLIIERLEEYKISDKEKFLGIYASLLLSDVPNKQNNEWLKTIFFDKVIEYLKANIPTKSDSYANDVQKVKISKLSLKVELSDFGLSDMNWFRWESSNDPLLTVEAVDDQKLGIEEWDIRDIIEIAEIDNLNKWIASQEVDKYNLFLNEIEKSHIRKATKIKLSKIKLFKFSDGNYYSQDDIAVNKNIVFNYNKTIKIKIELESLGFITSDLNISAFSNIYSVLHENFPSDKDLFSLISLKVRSNTLSANEKKKLFTNFTTESTSFDNVPKSYLSKLELFSDCNGNVKPLNQLIDSNLAIPSWLDRYKINSQENYFGLKIFLLSESDIYQEIVYSKWTNIIEGILSGNVLDFYTKVKYYFNLNEKNLSLKKQNYIYIDDVEKFVLSDNVFYNNKFAKIEKYIDFRYSVNTLTNALVPDKRLLEFFVEEPFKLDSSSLLEYNLNNGVKLDLEGLNALLNFCKLNNENFFGNYSVEKEANYYLITNKDKYVFQVFPSKQVRTFIESYYKDKFKLLPYELENYKNDFGVLSGEAFFKQFLEIVDVNTYKYDLINLISYDEPKILLLKKIDEIKFVIGETYDVNSFEYKILDVACQLLKNNDYKDFREKIVIKHGNSIIEFSKIPPVSDKIIIGGVELLLSEILPNSYLNSNLLNVLLEIFINTGLSKDKLYNLLNIHYQPKVDDIFSLLLEDNKLIENGSQLAFLLLYNDIVKVDFEEFSVHTLEKDYHLGYTYYLENLSFLSENAVLTKSYRAISNIVTLPIGSENECRILQAPYFSENGFECPFIKDVLNETEKTHFLTFIFKEYISNNTNFVKHLDWHKIGQYYTTDILGFNPINSVYPNEFAVLSEQLPNYVHEWVDCEKTKIEFLYALGVRIEGSMLVDLRRFFKFNLDFDKNRIAKAEGSNDKLLFKNTINWFIENDLLLKNRRDLEVFEEFLRVTNSIGSSEVETIETYDFLSLSKNSVEWDSNIYEKWKSAIGDKFTVYLHEGSLPKIIKVTEFEDYIFYRCLEGDIAIDENHCIYINKYTDIKQILTTLIAYDNDFTADDLLSLYQTSDDGNSNILELETLKNEVSRLKKIIEDLTNSSGRDANDVTTQVDDYLNEIKEEAEEYLFSYLKEKVFPNEVKWLNYNTDSMIFQESWQSHDFEVNDKEGNVLHYIDCKGTPYDKATFYLTSTEWEFFLECVHNARSYQIYRVYNMRKSPKVIHIDDLLKWIINGKVVPYLPATEKIKGGRVFLTLLNI